MTKAHNRKLGLIGVSLTNVRPPRNCLRVAAKVRDKIEAEMIRSEYLKGAPFEWITLALRYGSKKDDAPTYLGIDDKTGDLELAIEVDIHTLRSASESDLEEILSDATLTALIHAGDRYKLNNKGLIEYSH